MASSAQEQAIRVLLVEPVRLLGEALGVVLESDPRLAVVGVLRTTDGMGEQIDRFAPSVLLLGSRASGDDRLQLVFGLQRTHPAVKVLLLLPTLAAAPLAAFLEAGVAGCLSWDNSPGEIAAGVQRAAQGEIVYPSNAITDLLAGAGPPTPYTPLAPREQAVLQGFASGMNSHEVAQHLHITVNTVRTHLKHAMAKLNAHSRLEAVLVAHRHGLVVLAEQANAAEDSG